jgi:hypothetical protein
LEYLDAQPYHQKEIILRKGVKKSDCGFTPEEDEIILEFASFYQGPNKWGVSTIFVRDKTPDQVVNRWLKLTEKDF